MTSQQPGEPMPEDVLRVTHSRADGATIIAVAGEIDLRTAPILADAVAEGLDDTETGLCVVDLTEVTFLGSNGLAALLEATEHARDRGEPLRLVVDAARPVIRPIQITGLDHVLALYHTVEEALAARWDPKDA